MSGPLVWQIATLTDIRPDTPSCQEFTFALPEFAPHLPGQHYDIRLTAADGYQAQRSIRSRRSPNADRGGGPHGREIRMGRYPPTSTTNSSRVTAWKCGARSAATSSGGGIAEPLMLMARRVRHGPADGDVRHRAADCVGMLHRPGLLLANARGCDPLRRVGGPLKAGSLAPGAAHADALTTAGLDWLLAPNRSRHAGGGARAARGGHTGVHLRPDAPRGDCRRGAGGPGSSARPDQEHERFGPTGA